VGIFVYGVNAEITATVVRDTLPEQSTGISGRGIAAQCSSAGACGSLRVSSSLVTSSENVGIFIAGVPAILD
jgi:hypothetical protein